MKTTLPLLLSVLATSMKKLIFILLVLCIGLVIYLLPGSAVTKNTDSYVYELPYKAGTSHKIVQGYGGWFSHSEKAALDFSMPEGTAVHAARGGVIYSYKEDSDEGGLFSKNEQANYIIIQHDDGSFGCYWHLQKGGVTIKTGAVTKGQHIGYSGSTGFSLRPHLHFAVKRKLSYAKDAFVRTKFRTDKGIVLLERGNRYERP